MRKLFFVALCFYSISSFGQNKTNGNILNNKIDSLISTIKQLQNKKTDSTLLRIDKLDEVFKKAEPSSIDKYLPSIIAFLTVLISSGVAYWIGNKNANTQLINAETQARTQTAIALDQLAVSQKQIEQNTKNTLAQIRANNISKARVEWIQNLRVLLSDFFGNISEVSTKIDDMRIAKDKNVNEVTNLFNEIVPLLHKMQTQNNQIELYLNPDNESHKNLLDSIEEYMKVITAESRTQDNAKDNILAEKVIQKSRVVLKEAWEKAKIESETITD